MFRPIKNLITYIQKNTSGSSIFGGASGGGVASSNETRSTANKSETKVTEASTSQRVASAMENGKADGVYRRLPLGAVKTTEPTTTTPASPLNGNGPVSLYADDPDDIELHIKSSIVVKSPRPTVTPTVSASASSSSSSSSAHDHNQNVAKRLALGAGVDDELHTFSESHRVVVVEGPLSGREFYSFVAAQRPPFEERNEFLGENENAHDDAEQYLKFGDMPTEASSSAPLNVSLTSEDPLAIDETEFAGKGAGANLLHDDVVVELANEPNVAEDDLISLDSPSSQHAMLWLSEASPSKIATPAAKAKASPSTAKSRTGGDPVNGKQTNTCEEEPPSDGSDSGLGSETSTLQSTTLADTSLGDSPPEKSQSGEPPHAKPLRSNLKRRLEVDDDALTEGNASATSSGAGASASTRGQKKPKRSINFDGVQVFYFERQQGFGCVPSVGGCTLGMGATHSTMRTMTLAEHAAELRRAHRLQLQQQQEAKRHSGGTGTGTVTTSASNSGTATATGGSSSDDSEESEEDYLSEGSGSDLDGETNGFLQPVTPKQRRVILKAAGVRKIDASEKIECRDIRNSREVCGCTCRDFCDPDTCACSQAGIKCQVDRAMFPCGCSRDACGNIVGRVEFNPARVRTHFIHTIMRLEMENRQQQNPPPPFDSSTLGGVASRVDPSGQSVVEAGSASTGPSGGGYYGLQSQSAYSSGYASPAYSSDLPNYYQPPVVADGPQQQPHFVATEHTTPGVYPMDSLDSAGLFGASSANATPSYGELMPSYATTASYAHSMGYDYPSGQVSSYGAYHHLHQHHHHHQATPPANPYLPHATSCTNGDAATPSTYSSCAVPSMPPYGSATTTSSSSLTPAAVGAAVATTSYPPTSPNLQATPSYGTANVVSMDTNGGGSFINLSSPIASSSRLSQINDLLQHNRNTTAALVAVSTGASAASGDKLQHQMSSINTPPIEDAQKSCLNFEALPSPLHPTPIVAVLSDRVARRDDVQQQTRADEAPPKPTKPPPETPIAQADVVEGAKAKDTPNTNGTLGTN